MIPFHIKKTQITSPPNLFPVLIKFDTDIYYIPPSRWIAGGIAICAVSNLINTVKMFGGGMTWGGFLYEKGSKGKRVLLQDM